MIINVKVSEGNIIRVKSRGDANMTPEEFKKRIKAYLNSDFHIHSIEDAWEEILEGDVLITLLEAQAICPTSEELELYLKEIEVKTSHLFYTNSFWR